MNRPVAVSTPGTVAFRPATTVPNTTSVCPVSTPSVIPHAAASTPFAVTPRVRVSSRSRSASSADSAACRSPDATVTGTSDDVSPTSVGSSSPDSASRHAAVAPSWSWTASHPR